MKQSSLFDTNRTPLTLRLRAWRYAWLLALLCLPGFAQAQGTAFTYHGRLNDNGVPVNGAYDLRFSLYDAEVNGLVVAGPLNFSPVTVANGLFMVRPDFGANVFTGPARWLRIELRPAGGVNFTPLVPRQEVTSSPYAIRAQTAGTAAAVNPGSVVKSLNTLKDDVTLAAGANVTITPNGNTLTLAAAGVGGIWSLNGTNVYYNAGNVGVGRDINFGTQLRQMLNLYDTSFGVGVQNNAFYQRSGGEFVWYYGGAHSDAFLNGGGGQLLLRLNTTGLVTDRSFFFQSGTKQMLNLYNTTYGIGVQPSTMYFRTDNNSAGEGFAWYKGGAHADNTADPGPNGVKLMTLTSAGLNVTAAASVCSLTIRGGCDLAEPFPMANGEISKGSVVVIDDEHPGQLKLSTRACDTRVAGIISGANGVNTGIALLQEGTFDQGQNVALSGRVYVQADAVYGAIKPGDLLTTSGTPGHAMKVTDHARAQGAILGKAMTPLADGKGMVLVLVTLQ